MADKSTQLVLEALGRAAADPAGLPLHGGKSSPGLFAATATAREAAWRAKEEGFLRVVHSETRGKTTHEVCAITEKGLAFLLSQVSPRRVLEDFVRALEARQVQIAEVLAAARQIQENMDALKAAAQTVLARVNAPTSFPGFSANGTEDWTTGVLAYLAQWQEAHTSEDCPLPELYRQAHESTPGLTIGQFHDGLRRLYDAEQIYLHPWTGPLYEIPEPPYALLAGHEIAYYASLRK